MYSLFFGLIHSPFLSLYWQPQSRIGCHEIDREERRENKVEQHIYMNCLIQKL